MVGRRAVGAGAGLLRLDLVVAERAAELLVTALLKPHSGILARSAIVTSMSDDRLRELERVARENPDDVGAAAAFLREQLRSGVIERERVALAAHLGHAGARAALGDQAPPAPEDEEQLALGLLPYGRAVCTRAAVALARERLPDWERVLPDDLRPRRALEAAEAWLASPGEETVRVAEETSEAAADASGDTDPPGADAANIASWAAGCAYEDEERLRDAMLVVGRYRGSDVIRRALLAWALSGD